MEQDKWRRWIGAAVLVALALGLVVALSIRQTIRSAVKASDGPHRTVARADPESVMPPPQIPPPEQFRHDEVDQRTATDTQALGVTPRRTPAPDRQDVPDDEDLADARQAVLDATPEALVKGKPIKWRAGHLHGYVVPSEAQDYDTRICRNIYATTIDGQDQQEGRAQRWCRPADDDGWAPE